MHSISFRQAFAEASAPSEFFVPAQLFSDRLVVTYRSGAMALRWAVFTDGLEQYRQLARDPSTCQSARFQAEEE
jgi:hypothetical protein